MNDSRQFFSHSRSHTSRQNSINPLAIKVGDIIRYQIGEIMWIGLIIETNRYNYAHMAEVEWFNNGHTGTVDVRDCGVVVRA